MYRLSKTYYSIPKLALYSRLLIILLQCISNLVIPDHAATDVFMAPNNLNESTSAGLGDRVIERTLGGFRRWDAQYFLHIAEHGYSYEKSLAFFPLYPFIVGTVSRFMLSFFTFLTLRSMILMISVLLNMFFFVMAARALYGLTMLVFNDRIHGSVTVLLFCFNPASIFFSAPYSEALFAWMTFSGIYRILKNKNSLIPVIPFALSVMCRSNGLINIGFVIYSATQQYMHLSKLKNLCKPAIVCIAIISGFAIVQYYHFFLYCLGKNFRLQEHVIKYGIENNLVMMGRRTNATTSPWCDYNIPFSYSYIQNSYWGVGFMAYYQFKQIPNFILAAPILITLTNFTINFLSKNRRLVARLGFTKLKSNEEDNSNKIFVFIVHSLFLCVFCLFFVHIQISTRLLCSASPVIYWIGAELITTEFSGLQKIDIPFKFIKKNAIFPIDLFLKSIYEKEEMKKSKLFVLWFLLYYLTGTVLFSNYLPWT